MIESLNYFISSHRREDLLAPMTEISVIHPDNQKCSIQLLKDIEGTYIPRCWIATLRDYFLSSGEIISTNVSNDSSLIDSYKNNCLQFVKRLTSEQLFISDNIKDRFPKSGLSFVGIDVDGEYLNITALGDNFVFIYDQKNAKLSAYCSMIGVDGKINFESPGHSLYSDLTYIGNPLTVIKKYPDCYVFVMTKDLANCFLEDYSKDHSETMSDFCNMQVSSFETLLQKYSKRSQYRGLPFNIETAGMVIINLKQENKRLILLDKIKKILIKYKLLLLGIGSLAVLSLVIYLIFKYVYK